MTIEYIPRAEGAQNQPLLGFHFVLLILSLWLAHSLGALA